jgi:uncharacterized membrane protein SirB2
MKHMHMTLALISIIFFTLRFIWLMMDAKVLQSKWVKIAPHIIDTFLLLLGIGLAVKLSINPLEQLWLAEKLLAMVAYIFTGYYTLKVARTRFMKIMGFLGAFGWFVLIVRIVMTKSTVLF